MIGFVISLFIIFYNLQIKGVKMNTFSLVCTVMATCFLTNYFLGIPFVAFGQYIEDRNASKLSS
jgi:hypothetical protein